MNEKKGEEALEETEVKGESPLEEGLEGDKEVENKAEDDSKGDKDRKKDVSDDDMTPEELARHEADYEEFKKIAEETRQRVLDIKDEDACLEYKKMMGLAPLSQEVKKEERLIRKEGEDGKVAEEKEVVFYGKCGECGKELPYDQLCDNGSYLVCKGCL